MVNEYEVVWRLAGGREETARVFAWSAADAPFQGFVDLNSRLGEDVMAGCKLVSVRPPLELCHGAALNGVIERLAALATDAADKGPKRAKS